MSRIAYYRVSTSDQSIKAQRAALTQQYAIDKEFLDEGVSGSILAKHRPGFAALLSYVREGDSVHVYAVDRLGRDALDVQSTIRDLMIRGVLVEIHGLGAIGRGVGELIIAVLAQVADMERQRIAERTASGRDLARSTLATTGRTHRGKLSLGRPAKADPETVRSWRAEHGTSIQSTAEHFGLSTSTVKRYCAAGLVDS